MKQKGIRYHQNRTSSYFHKITPQERRALYQAEGRQKAQEGSALHMIGCMLYWAEGSKRNANSVQFVNSDPNMIELFIRFLREEIRVQDEWIKLTIQSHSTDIEEKQRIGQYWLNFLSLSPENLRSVITKQGSANKFRKNIFPNGFCVVHIYRLQVLHHILGAIQEYGDFDNHEWGHRL